METAWLRSAQDGPVSTTSQCADLAPSGGRSEGSLVSPAQHWHPTWPDIGQTVETLDVNVGREAISGHPHAAPILLI